MLEKLKDYQPTKTAWFWSTSAAVVAVVAGGFMWGGWVTAGTAQERVNAAVKDARAELAAAMCVERFMAAGDADQMMTTLQQTSAWKRRGFIEDAGFVSFVGFEKPVVGAAAACADRLLAQQSAKAS